MYLQTTIDGTWNKLPHGQVEVARQRLTLQETGERLWCFQAFYLT